jgi:hypothetical protein
MMDDPASWLQKAAKSRLLADRLWDERIQASLRALADQYEAKAAASEPAHHAVDAERP